MSDKLTLDFENNQITIETDNQKSTEYADNLKEKKAEIYKLLGFETVNITPAIKVIEDLINGKISEEEMQNKLEDWLKE